MNEREIFQKALDISDAAQRQAFLGQACGPEGALRGRIEALLASHAAASQFLDQPALEQMKPPGADSISPTITLPQRGQPGAGPSDDEDDEHGAPDVSFLNPSSKAGSLGTLGHYEVLQVLGQGGFGIVFKAFDEKLHRHVAIKAMNPQMAATSPPRKRFLREARSAAAIKHENIVQVYSVEELPLPYLVMEFVEGQTLQQKLEQAGPLEVAEILHLGRQMAAGLAAAHAQGLIHRDIKPGNILIEAGAEQKLKITDFGLARAADDASMTRTGLISGTPMYMAPEQALGQTLDHRADLFSLGSVLYQMTSGRAPFRAPTAIAVLKRVTDETPRAIQTIIPEAPDWLCAIIIKLHAKQPEERFQSAREVADLLACCQSELLLNGKVSSVSPRAGSVSAQSQPTASSSTKLTSATTEGSRPPRAAERSVTRSRSLKRGLLVLLPMVALMVLIPLLNGPIKRFLNPPIPMLPTTQVLGGLNFDGKDDFVKVSPVNWSYPQFTIEAFVTSTRQSDNGTIAYLSDGKSMEWMSLWDGPQADPGKRISGASAVGKSPWVGAYAPLTPDVRQHRALVFDSKYLHYYLNGIWQGKRFAEAHEGLMWKMRELRIGCNGEDKQFFEGRIDQLRVSKVARYDNNFAPVTSVANDDLTLALYNFDAGQGDVLKDASGNGHDGKIVGATWGHPASGGRGPSKSSATTTESWQGWPADAPKPAIAPFDAAQAKQHQAEWASYLKLPVEYTNSLGMKFVLIPPGEFTMGSTPEEIEAALKDVDLKDKHWQECIKSEAPQHKVILTQAIYLGLKEVTQADYQKVMGTNPSHFAATGMGKGSVVGMETTEHPVETVSWNDAAEFCGRVEK